MENKEKEISTYSSIIKDCKTEIKVIASNLEPIVYATPEKSDGPIGRSQLECELLELLAMIKTLRKDIVM